MLHYFIILVLALLVCYLFGYKHWNVCAVCVATLMAILAYNMEVFDASDLNRYYDYLDVYRDISIQRAFSFAISKNNPLHHLILILFSKFSNNQWFPTIMTFSIYYLLVKLVDNVCNDKQLSRNVYVTSIAFILLNLNFYLVANVVRIFFVFTAFFYCLYEESVRRKHRLICWVVYGLLVFYHYAVLIMITSRILSLVIEKSSAGVSKTIYKCIMIALLIIGLAILLNSSLGDYIIFKIDSYSNYATRGTMQTIVGWIQFSMALLILLSNKYFKIESNKTYGYVIILLFIVNLVTYSNYQMILRFGNAMAMCSCIPISLTNQNEVSVYSFRNFRISDVIVCVGSLIVFTYTMFFYYRIFL